MKRMRLGMVAILAVGLVLGASTSGASVPDQELYFRFSGFAPRETEDWESGSGIEMQWRLWRGGNVGLGLAAGIDTWEAKPVFVEDETASSYYATGIEGYTTLFPIGLSALSRTDLGGQVALMMEAGVRYVFTDSNVTIASGWADSTGDGYVEDELGTDEFVLGVLGVAVSGMVGDGMSVHGGIGYQVDLIRPREYYQSADIGETRFQALSAHVGMSWAF